MDFFFLIGFICKRDKDHQMSFLKIYKPFYLIIMFVLLQHFNLLSNFLISIIVKRVFISFKDSLNSYNKKSLIFTMWVYLRFIIM
jgi:hypothetical protein